MKGEDNAALTRRPSWSAEKGGKVCLSSVDIVLACLQGSNCGFFRGWSLAGNGVRFPMVGRQGGGIVASRADTN